MGEARCGFDTVDEVARRHAAAVSAKELVQCDHAIRLRHGKWTQDDGMDRAEDGAVGADAERQRQHGDE